MKVSWIIKLHHFNLTMEYIKLNTIFKSKMGNVVLIYLYNHFF